MDKQQPKTEGQGNYVTWTIEDIANYLQVSRGTALKVVRLKKISPLDLSVRLRRWDPATVKKRLLGDNH